MDFLPIVFLRTTILSEYLSLVKFHIFLTHGGYGRVHWLKENIQNGTDNVRIAQRDSRFIKKKRSLQLLVDTQIFRFK